MGRELPSTNGRIADLGGRRLSAWRPATAFDPKETLMAAGWAIR
jgi:hypothetical protein